MLRSLSHYLQFLLIRHSSSCALQPTSFIRSSFRSIPPHSQPMHFCFSQSHPSLRGTKQTHKGAYFLSQTHPSLLWVTFHCIHRYFISVAFSPPAANIFCSPVAPLRLRSVKCCYCLAHTSLSQCIAKLHLYSAAASIPLGKYTPAAFYRACITIAWLYCKPLRGGSLSIPFVPHSMAILSARRLPFAPPRFRCGYSSFGCRHFYLYFYYLY